MTTKYTEEHEWVREQDGVHIVGITNHAQEQLGEVVFIELPEVNAKLGRGDEVAVIESVKAAGEIKSPLGGEVIAVNDQLSDNPELVNQDPEGEGWIYKLRTDDGRPMEELMDADAYQDYVHSLE